MTTKEALSILIKAGARDIIGSGRGYRSTTEEWRKNVKDAIEKIYPKVYGHKMSKADKFNLGIL